MGSLLLVLVKRLIPSAVLVISAALLLPAITDINLEYQQALKFIPYLIVFIVILMGYGFNRSRIVFAGLNIVCAYYLIQYGLQVSLDRPDAFVLFSLISVLLPLNFGLIALYRERGLLTIYGGIRLFFVLIGYLVLYLLWEQAILGNLLPKLPVTMLEMVTSDSLLSQMAAFAFVLSLLPIFISFVVRKTYTDAALLTCLIASFLMIEHFNQPMISVLFVSASLVALALSVVQNSYQMAFMDELTGIPARRALQDRFSTLSKKYTLAICDIDYFKKFNDTYGHDVGDQVLKMVAARLNLVAGGGRAYRYGGEEFTLVFAGKTEEQALPFIEQLRLDIASYPMHIRQTSRPDDSKKGQKMRQKNSQNQTVCVNISIGVCEKTPDLDDPESVLKKADEALYEAKNNGRNCVIAAHSKPKVRRRRSRKDYAKRLA